MQNNDYISREAAIKAITELMSSPWATEGTPMYSIGIKEALSLVRDMIRGNVPKGMQIPDADVRPVVKCSECENAFSDELQQIVHCKRNGEPGYVWCKKEGCCRKEDFFCANGVKYSCGADMRGEG